MPSNLTPTVVKQTQFTTEEISRRADPDWIRDRNYLRAYEFGPGGKRKFIDHRDNVYQEDEVSDVPYAVLFNDNQVLWDDQSVLFQVS